MKAECEKCGTGLYDNTRYFFYWTKDYICPKCTSLPRVLAFILAWVLLLIPLPENTPWGFAVKVIALLYMARLLQSFIACLPYFLKLKK